MAYNLFIAYDLMSPGQSYDRVIEEIKALGQWHQFQMSLWYVHTEHSPDAAFALVHAACDANDRLAVINCAGDFGAIVTNWDHPPIDAINTIWTQG